MIKTDFEQLFMAMYPGLYRLACSILRHEADAQDAVQQAAVNAWAAADRMKPGGEKAYITRVVINECRNIQRHRLRIVPMERPEDTPDPSRPDSELKRQDYRGVVTLEIFNINDFNGSMEMIRECL